VLFRSLLADALATARAAGDPALVGGVLVSEYLALWDPSTTDRRARIGQEVGRAARATGDPDLRFLGGYFEAMAAAERCDVATARARLEALRPDAEATHNFYFVFLVERFLISLDILTGRPDVQDDVDELAARYADTHADTDGTWSLQTGGIAIQAGRLGSLEGALAGMIEASAVGSNWTAGYGLALALNGDRDGASTVLDGIDDPPLDYFWLVTTMAIAELVVTLGRADRAAGLRERLAPFGDQLAISASGSLCLGLVRTALGQLALLEGDPDAAIELLVDAWRVADSMGAPYESTKARRVLAEALVAAGRPADEVDAVVEEAAALAGRYGFDGESLALLQLAASRTG